MISHLFSSLDFTKQLGPQRNEHVNRGVLKQI